MYNDDDAFPFETSKSMLCYVDGLFVNFNTLTVIMSTYNEIMEI